MITEQWVLPIELRQGVWEKVFKRRGKKTRRALEDDLKVFLNYSSVKEKTDPQTHQKYFYDGIEVPRDSTLARAVSLKRKDSYITIDIEFADSLAARQILNLFSFYAFDISWFELLDKLSKSEDDLERHPDTSSKTKSEIHQENTTSDLLTDTAVSMYPHLYYDHFLKTEYKCPDIYHPHKTIHFSETLYQVNNTTGIIIRGYPPHTPDFNHYGGKEISFRIVNLSNIDRYVSCNLIVRYINPDNYAETSTRCTWPIFEKEQKITPLKPFAIKFTAKALCEMYRYKSNIQNCLVCLQIIDSTGEEFFSKIFTFRLECNWSSFRWKMSGWRPIEEMETEKEVEREKLRNRNKS